MACMNCTWSKANHTNAIAASLTCGDFRERNTRGSVVLAVDPDKCQTCSEFFTPHTTKGAIKCKCDMPKPPRSVLVEANKKAPTPFFRYGN